MAAWGAAVPAAEKSFSKSYLMKENIGPLGFNHLNVDAGLSHVSFLGTKFNPHFSLCVVPKLSDRATKLGLSFLFL